MAARVFGWTWRAGLVLAAAAAVGMAQPAESLESPEAAGAEAAAGAAGATTPATRPTETVPFPALQYKLPLVGGDELDLSRFRGRVVVIVPVAWDANRRQFEDLQVYSSRFSDRGLAVVAVLTRDFGRETRDDAEVVAGIRQRYRTTFPIVTTTVVSGDDAHPLFKYFAATDAGHAHGGPITSAFTKFLIDRNGELAQRWDPATRLISDEAVGRTLQVIDTPMR